MKLGNIFKKFEGIDTTILLVSLCTVVVIIVLAVKHSKKEDFQISQLAENWWSIKGLDGSPGEEGGIKDTTEINKQATNKIIEYMKDMGLIIEEINAVLNEETGTYDTLTKYFPVGTINMKTVIDTDELFINKNEVQSNNKYFNVSYNKKAKNSYVKITYTITLTGNNDKSNQFEVYSSDNNKPLSAKHSVGGVSNSYWKLAVPKSIEVIGIDTSDNIERKYFIKSYNLGSLKINGVNSNEDTRVHNIYRDAGYLSSSCTIEEIMVPNKKNTKEESNFIDNTI
jgi:hypothetical protein